MSEAIDLAAAAWTNQDLYDWLESDVIAMNAHPFGWEFLVEGQDGEPITEDAFKVEADYLPDALRKARAQQERLILAKRAGE